MIVSKPNQHHYIPPKNNQKQQIPTQTQLHTTPVPVSHFFSIFNTFVFNYNHTIGSIIRTIVHVKSSCNFPFESLFFSLFVNPSPLSRPPFSIFTPTFTHIFLFLFLYADNVHSQSCPFQYRLYQFLFVIYIWS